MHVCACLEGLKLNNHGDCCYAHILYAKIMIHSSFLFLLLTHTVLGCKAAKNTRCGLACVCVHVRVFLFGCVSLKRSSIRPADCKSSTQRLGIYRHIWKGVYSDCHLCRAPHWWWHPPTHTVKKIKQTDCETKHLISSLLASETDMWGQVRLKWFQTFYRIYKKKKKLIQR